MTGPTCPNDHDRAVQRIVVRSADGKPTRITFRCKKHRWSKARAKLHNAVLFDLDVEAATKNSVVPSALRPDCDDAIDVPHPAVRSATKEKTMTPGTKEAAAKTPTAPKPGRGFTVVELRTPHQSDIVKASTKGSPAGSVKFEDKWVVVKNTDAQAVVDKVIGNAGEVGIFDRRVLDYFVAVVLLANDKLTDSRSSLHQRLIAVGRTKPGFRFEMKQDGTLLVHDGAKLLGTQKEAMKVLDPAQLKAPARPAGSSSGGGKSNGNGVDYEAAKTERKALKEWEAADEKTRGARPSTDNYDALSAEYERKEAVKAKEAEARKAEAAEAAPKKKSGSTDVTPIPKKTTSARKAS